jgi:plasmid stabilization system protein ParE
VRWDIVRRPAAERDLRACAAHIVDDNVDAALRFIDEVEQTVNALAESVTGRRG